MFSRKSLSAIPLIDNFQWLGKHKILFYTIKNILKNSINFYHNYISSLMLCQCRFHPTCSQYALSAIEDKGVFFGLLKGLGRIIRCNPFSKGGYDPYISNQGRHIKPTNTV